MLQHHVVEVVEVVQKAKKLWQMKDGDQWRNKGKSMEAAKEKSTTGNATRRQKVRRWKDCCFALREHRGDGGISCVFLWESGHLARHPQVPASVAINYPPQMLLSGGRRDCGEAPLRWFLEAQRPDSNHHIRILRTGSCEGQFALKRVTVDNDRKRGASSKQSLPCALSSVCLSVVS